MQIPVSARAVLLQALSYPGHGRELIERIRHATGGAISLNPGSVYPALEDLARRRLIRRLRGDETRARGRPAHTYELTLRGVAAVTKLRREIAGLFPPPVALSSQELERMQRRLRDCEAISATGLALQRAVTQARR